MLKLGHIFEEYTLRYKLEAESRRYLTVTKEPDNCKDKFAVAVCE